MPSPTVTEPQRASLAAEGPLLWPWVLVLAVLAACALACSGRPGWALAALAAPAPWFGLQLLPFGGGAFGRGHRGFETARREVWLTIDDGPDPATTPRLLERLSSLGMKATFFLIGEKARAHPELVARIVAEGHELGCHTEHHRVGSFWSAFGGRMRREVDGCAAYLRRFGPVRYFRPPVGLKGPFLPGALRRCGLTLVLWSARGLDGLDRPPMVCLRRLQRGSAPGGILLVHEVSADPARCLEYFDRVTGWLASAGFATALPDPQSLRFATGRGEAPPGTPPCTGGGRGASGTSPSRRA